MLVTNKEARLLEFAPGYLKPAEGETIKFSGLVLRPGNNEVDPEVWAGLKELDTVQAMLKERKLIEVKAQVQSKVAEPADQPKPETPTRSVQPTDLAKVVPVDKAIEIVEDTYDKTLLEGWAESDTRKGVQEAITKQLEQLNRKVDKPSK